ncbi:hypothetical protein GYA49_06245 [Candidatus Beckwithbacteria bacterium]|nr:hypothetical protein [Candidatus Beckwithbacteria bacterium]
MAEPLSDQFRKNPALIIGVALLVVLLLGALGYLTYRQFQPPKKSPEVMVVSFNDGQNEVIVNRNGTVTIKTPHGTFTQKWDPAKIKQFFENIDNLDFDLLSKFIGTDVAITLTFNDGQKIIVAIDPQTEAIADTLEDTLEEVYEEEESETGQTILPSYIPTPIPTAKASTGATPTPTPTSSSSSNSSSDNPWQQGTEPENAIKTFVCNQYDPATGKKVVISNTLCAQ